MSHNVKTKVEYKNTDALDRAVKFMGGSVLGNGQHTIWGRNTAKGFGFRLPGWNYPLVLQSNGDLVFESMDAYGKDQSLSTLKDNYAIETAAMAAEAEGWITQRTDQGELEIFVDGGKVTVSKDGAVDATGFIGPACEGIVNKIAASLGQEESRYCKPEYSQTHINQDVVEDE